MLIRYFVEHLADSQLSAEDGDVDTPLEDIKYAIFFLGFDIILHSSSQNTCRFGTFTKQHHLRRQDLEIRGST